jgi:hypothetical protein
MSSHHSEDPAVEALLDLLVYAPLGLAMELSARFPDYAARGRSTVEAQVGTARFIGEFAVQQATRQFRQWADRNHGSQSEATGSGDSSATTAAPPVHEPVPTPADGPAEEAGIATAVTSEELPLADYDSLAAAQILPRLVGLTTEELDAVRRYELAHRARKTVLGKIEQLTSQ